jgi:hypothetical protein
MLGALEQKVPLRGAPVLFSGMLGLTAEGARVAFAFMLLFPRLELK